MLLNNALVEKIREIMVKSLSSDKDGDQILEHDLGDELVIKFIPGTFASHWTINGFYIESEVGPMSKAFVNKHIAKLLVNLAIDKAEQQNVICDMFNGITTDVSLETVIGLTVNFHCDVDSRRLMIAQTANPNNVLYAIEEAVNLELSIDPALMTSSNTLYTRTIELFSDYLMADLITHDVAI